MSDCTDLHLGQLIGFHLDGMTVVQVWTKGQFRWRCHDVFELVKEMKGMVAIIEANTLGLGTPFLAH